MNHFLCTPRRYYFFEYQNTRYIEGICMYLFLLNVEVYTVLLDMALTREQSEGIKCDFDIRTFLCVI